MASRLESLFNEIKTEELALKVQKDRLIEQENEYEKREAVLGLLEHCYKMKKTQFLAQEEQIKKEFEDRLRLAIQSREEIHTLALKRRLFTYTV